MNNDAAGSFGFVLAAINLRRRLFNLIRLLSHLFRQCRRDNMCDMCGHTSVCESEVKGQKYEKHMKKKLLVT